MSAHQKDYYEHVQLFPNEYTILISVLDLK